MRNLDAIINQLANEQQRTSHLLKDDIAAIKKEAQLFFDKQARESDAYLALLCTRFDDLLSRIDNGYPQGQLESIGDIPAIVQRRVLSDDEKQSILSKLGEIETDDP